MTKIFLKEGKEKVILRGHPWLFSGAIQRVEGSGKPGDVAAVCDPRGVTLAKAFYNPKSDIACRILTLRPEETIDADFWRKRLTGAMALRKRLLPPHTNAYRVVNADGDAMPGLVVDIYNDTLVFSISTLGMEKCRTVILSILQELMPTAFVYERSDGKSRQREGLSNRSGWVGAEKSEPVIISENGLAFQADVRHGQKTGFFLDQRDNRFLLGSLSRDLTVLNCFSYSGGFSVYAVHGGATQVTSVDVSGAANQLAQENFALNSIDRERHPIVTADVFEYIRHTDEKFDLIVLDPPAFAKTQKDVEQASRGYKDINLQAIRKLKSNGFLMTFSCSNHLTEDLFVKVVTGAVQDAHRSAQVLHVLGPGFDHPYVLAHPEGKYLKGLLLRIV
jgi:23S rRNA (cytosine1962-C5)-methyltransferase